MLEDRDFEFPKRESKLDRVRIEWKNLTNDKEKRRYCDELEGVIQDLEDELDLKNKEIDKLDKTRKKLGGYLGSLPQSTQTLNLPSSPYQRGQG